MGLRNHFLFCRHSMEPSWGLQTPGLWVIFIPEGGLNGQLMSTSVLVAKSKSPRGKASVNTKISVVTLEPT